MKKLYCFKVFFAVSVLFFTFAAIEPVTGYAKMLPSLSEGSPLTPSEYYVNLKPASNFTAIEKEILRQLSDQHYEADNLEINDAFSSKLFDRYISDMDPSRLFFLESDIREFEKYRNSMDNVIESGNLSIAFDMFNKHQKRTAERMIFAVNFIDHQMKNLKFDQEETFELNREKAPWPTTEKEVDEIWQKRLKNEALGLKLSGKAINDIVDLLSKRYRSQLNRLGQNNNQDVFQLFMNSFTQMYDPHTQYFPPRASENFNIQMSLSLEGIGAVLQRENEYTKVLRLVVGGPADKSGQLKPGDLIVGVGQGAKGEIVDVIGWRLDDAVQLIRGPKGTTVSLRIIPASDTQNTKLVRIVRDTVKLEDQAAHKDIKEIKRADKTYKIGIIEIPTFYMDFKGFQSGKPNFKSTTRDVRDLINELKSSNVEGLLIDLRDNGGGPLQEANSLSGLFIKSGPIVQVEETSGRINQYFDQDPEILYEGPLIVLVNALSASASEIFAGAIQDYNRGLIIGGQTFGKGTVQTLMDLKEGQLKLTYAKFYRINGNSTQYEGVIPDIKFPQLYDREKISESSLPNALAWDQTKPTVYVAYPALTNVVSDLSKQHDERIKTDPDFKYLISTIDYRKKQQDKTLVSLSETKRKNELEASKKFLLELENTRRTAKGLTVLTKLEEEEKPESEDDEETTKKDKSNDAYLNESENILVDYIIFTKKTTALR